jgi:hypothetical protein
VNRALATAVVLGAVAAAGAEPEAPNPELADIPGGGLLQVGIADSSSFTPTTTNTNLGNTQLPTLVSTIRAGAYFAKHSEISLGLSFSYVQLSSGNGSNQQSVFDAVLAPTYRYHFTPLRPWALSPFVEVQLLLGINNVGFSGSPSQTTPEFGATAGVGGEYMLGDRFGLLISAGARIIAFTSGGNSFPGSGTSILAFQVWGSAAVSLHF